MDDEIDVLEGLEERLDKHFGGIIEVEGFLGAEEALRHMEENTTAMVVTDLLMPGMQGDEFVRHASEYYGLGSVVLTGHGTKEYAINLLKAGGVIDYFTKGEQSYDEMMPSVARGLSQFFSSSGLDHFFTFSEPSSIAELRDYFTERYLVWLEQGWIPPNKDRLNTDEYDLFSRFYLIHAHSIMKTALVGGVRNIYPEIPEDEKGIFNKQEEIVHEALRSKRLKDDERRFSQVPQAGEEQSRYPISEFFGFRVVDRMLNEGRKTRQRILNTAKELIAQPETMYQIHPSEGEVVEYPVTSSPQMCGLPGMKVHPELKDIIESYDGMISEIGRLLITPSFRLFNGGEDLRGRFFEEIFGRVENSSLRGSIICVNPNQFRWYRPLGFQPLDTDVQLYYEDAPSQAYLLDLKGYANRIDEARFFRIRHYKESISRGDVSCYCVNHEECLDSGFYESRDEKRHDILCPRVVHDCLSRYG